MKEAERKSITYTLIFGVCSFLVLQMFVTTKIDFEYLQWFDLFAGFPLLMSITFAIVLVCHMRINY